MIILEDPVLSDITQEWYRIKPALIGLCEKNAAFDLCPEEVYDACVTENAQLWITPEGFMVTRFIEDPSYSVGKTLFLWVAATFDGGKDAGLKYLEFFEGVAKYMNCQYIELWSSRPGMERYIARHGFGKFYTAFRKTIDHG